MDLKALEKRRERARTEKDHIQPLLDEVFDYCVPYRRTAHKTGKGENRVADVFDHTAIDAAHRFAGKFQQDLWPPNGDNFALEPGPVVMDQADRDAMNAQLQPITKVLKAFFDSAWDMAFQEMALDLVAGTGAMLMNPGDMEEGRLWEPIAIPIDELLLDAGAHGRVSGIFWNRKMSGREIIETYPDAQFETEFKKALNDKPEDAIDVFLDTVHTPKANEGMRWTMTVWCKKQTKPIYETKSRTCPWIIPRYYRVAGETWGRGLGMIAMPSIKTTNTTARLQLAAAAIALLGIYTAVDDGVFNPDLAVSTPGAIWKVGSNGGARGPSVQRMRDPSIDLGNIILQDLRMSIKATMMDQGLPPDSSGAKSATEIVERIKRLAADYLGAFGRLVEEIHAPAVRRVMELAYNQQLLPDEIDIDQLLVRLTVKSPVAVARATAQLEKNVQWLELILSVAAQKQDIELPDRVAKIDDILSELGRAMGVDAPHITTAEQRAAMQEQKQQEQAAMMAAQAAAAGMQQEPAA